MSSPRCLICSRELNGDGDRYHRLCCRRFFGQPTPPELPYDWDGLSALAERVIRSRISVPGVQPKLSLHLDRAEGHAGRLTLVGLWGDFVLKPPHKDYPGMPELEHACMLMAQAGGIATVPFALMPLNSGELAYLCRRVDRDRQGKLHMEDMAQLTGKLTEQKYRGSMEQVGKALWHHSSTPLLDAVRLFELACYCFLTANSDMHLKNFSLLYGRDGRIRLSPAYDLLPTQVLLPSDTEEAALTLNGKKSKLQLRDFLAFAESLRLTGKQAENALDSLQRSLPSMLALLPDSFTSMRHQDDLRRIMNDRAQRLGLAP